MTSLQMGKKFTIDCGRPLGPLYRMKTMVAVPSSGNIPFSKQGEKSLDEKLLQPYAHVTQVPGKNIRVKLIRAFDYWLNIPEDKLVVVEDITQVLHNATLLIDDIEDNSVLRRGIPVAHSIYGVSSTINSANYVYFIALEKVFDLNHPMAVKVFTEQILELHRGQGLELHWRNNFTCPTEEEYCEMAIKKTGGLFRMAVQLAQLFSTNKKELSTLAEMGGLLFQIADDYKNLKSQIYFDNKSYCEDITEGKFGFPVVHALQKYPDDQQIISIIRQRTNNVELKKHCVSLLEKFGSFEYTREKLKKLRSEIIEEIELLGGNEQLINIINSICSNVL